MKVSNIKIITPSDKLSKTHKINNTKKTKEVSAAEREKSITQMSRIYYVSRCRDRRFGDVEVNLSLLTGFCVGALLFVQAAVVWMPGSGVSHSTACSALAGHEKTTIDLEPNPNKLSFHGKMKESYSLSPSRVSYKSISLPLYLTRN